MYKMMTTDERKRKAESVAAASAAPVASTDPAALRAEAARQLVEDAAARTMGPAATKEPSAVEFAALRKKRGQGRRTVADVVASITGMPGAATPMVPAAGQKAARQL